MICLLKKKRNTVRKEDKGYNKGVLSKIPYFRHFSLASVYWLSCRTSGRQPTLSALAKLLYLRQFSLHSSIYEAINEKLDYITP